VPQPLRIVVAGGADAASRREMADALVAALDADTGLGRDALAVDALDDPAALRGAAQPSIVLLCAPAPRSPPHDDDERWRSVLVDTGAAWVPLPPEPAAALAAALDATAPLVRGLAPPRDGLFTRLAERNRSPLARTWRCERCDDPRCEHAVSGRGPDATRPT
jgi:hypothetical protein